MPHFKTEIYIDADDFLNSINDKERKELIKLLVEDGYITPQPGVLENKNILDLEWDLTIKKLAFNRLRLSNDDEEIIKSIANKI
jgi:hypothetical protein